MNPKHTFILNRIREATPDRPITGNQLADEAFQSGLTIRLRDVADMVSDLVTEAHHPIVSGPNGYCWARSYRELSDGIRFIKHKHLAHHNRVNALEAIRRKMMSEETGKLQMGLF